MVLPDFKPHIDQVVILDREIITTAHAAMFKNHTLIFHFGQVFKFNRFEFFNQLFGFFNPVTINFIPVFVVVARPFHEERNPGLNLFGVGNTYWCDVDMAINDAMIDAFGRWYHENS